VVLLGVGGSRWRCLLVWGSGTTALATVLRLQLPDVDRLWASRAELGTLPLDVVLVEMCACVLSLCAAWASVALTAAVVDAWRGSVTLRRRPWHLPAGVRRVVLAACGVALASGITAPVRAADGRTHRHLDDIGALTGLPLPERAVAPRPATSPRRTVVVRRGDSLWSIAERDLAPDATDRAVARRWHAIYAANRDLVGPDPDLIEPGQRLHLPRKDRS
jgi:hypothetical protein